MTKAYPTPGKITMIICFIISRNTGSVSRFASVFGWPLSRSSPLRPPYRGPADDDRVIDPGTRDSFCTHDTQEFSTPVTTIYTERCLHTSRYLFPKYGHEYAVGPVLMSLRARGCFASPGNTSGYSSRDNYYYPWITYFTY